ncbi:MAG: hypothetical protein R2845_04360 [Thermomicrobiales bacterium]
MPPIRPAARCGSDWAKPTSPAWAGLPVVCRTNQGSATAVSAFPMRETTPAASIAYKARRAAETESESLINWSPAI